AHEVPRLLAGEQGCGIGGRVEHGRAVLADAEAADRVAVEAERDELLARAAAELAVEPALRDCEPELAGRAFEAALPFRPQRRAADGFLELGARHARGRADVEAHRDV